MANVTFKDLAGILKYHKQMKEVIQHASKENPSDKEGYISDSEDDDAEVLRKEPKKVSVRQIKQSERVQSRPTFKLYGKVGRQNIQMLIDTEVELTICTKGLTKKLGLNY